MANKKYYWLKLKKEFFKQKTIKKMRQLPGGEVYALIFLEMLTIATETEGVIYYENIESTPEEELALTLDEDVNAVKMTVSMLRMMNLLEDCKNGDFFLPDAVKMTGSESESAERMRRMREKHKVDNENTQKIESGNTGLLPEASHCDAGVTESDASHCDGDVTECNEGKTGIIPNMPASKSGKIGIIPNMPASENGSQKVKNSPETAPVLGLEEPTRSESVTLCKNVQNSDEHKEIEIEIELDKEILNYNKALYKDKDFGFNNLLSNHPSNEDISSLKSAVDSNYNITRVNARTIEESTKTDADHPEEPSTQTGDPVQDESQSLDGWMDGSKKNVAMPEAELETVFQMFRENYPRRAGKLAVIKKIFREMVYLHKIDPYDLATAAAKYAEHVKNEETKERFIKMPQNFLTELTWVRYIPVYREHCPKCHGKGIYEDKDSTGRTFMTYCDCQDRYKKLYSRDTQT
jgi:predicted phage replisome organizer